MLNLTTGAPTNLGTIGSGQLGIVDISVNPVNPVPEPSTLSLLAVAAGAAWLVRRRREKGDWRVPSVGL
jgi:PEP-CTERM motif